MSISRIFDISKRSLLSHQAAINTTAKNISNVNTEGYKRRQVDLSKLGIGFSGINGTQSPKAITRIRQRFAEVQLYQENHELGKYTSKQMLLTRVEDIYGEPRESALSNTLAQFWSSWGELANDPENNAARSRVKDKGQMLALTLNSLYNDMTEFQRQIGMDVQDKVAEVNRLSRQIFKINKQIGSSTTNDLLDERDVLIGKLSSLIDVDVREKSGQEVTISTGGNILVSASIQSNIEVNIQNQGADYSIDIKLTETDKPLTIRSGELGGLLETVNEILPSQIDQINTLAITIAENVNSLHQTGYDLNDNSGFYFFKNGITSAGDFALNNSIINNPTLIVTSDVIGEAGNGTIAQNISNLRNMGLIDNQSTADYYNSMISHIGNSVQEVTFLKRSQEKVVQSLRNQRDSVSAVSLDEEMTKLIEYQRGYQAATKMIITANEMVQTLLNLI